MLESEQELPRATASRFQETARQLDAAILFYWLGPARSYLWKVTSRGVELHELPSELEISEQAEAYLARILQGRDPIAEGAPEPEWLYRTLVGPASLAAGSRVVFVPDGVLHQLNPETFVVPSPKPHYWIEDVTLTTAPSVSILGARGRVAPPRESVRQILLIGDPEPVGAEFPRLVHARGELERIAGEFPLAMRAVYTGSTAEPAAYRASEPGRFAYIHFAAHAQANRQVPLESAVILSPRNDLSKLYAREIVGLPLRAELVTLSACRGAGAREFAGEGLVGLTWAFLSSGAGNVIAGLWNVEDASTADLMTGLYGRLAKGEGPAEALRQAKLELRRADPAYAKPYYWAPFVTYTRGSVRRP
jgi:CHAT domain-containing protein